MEAIIHTDNWVNVNDMKKKNPNFYVPSDEELDSIKTGDLVKICNGIERFFVIVKEVSLNGNIKGIVDNYLIFEADYDYKDYVEFHRDHIYDITKGLNSC